MCAGVIKVFYLGCALWMRRIFHNDTETTEHSHGDANFKQKSQKVMEEKVKSDKTIVMVSHSLPLLQRLCDRILWIERGQTHRSGDPGEILPAYREHLQRSNGAA